MRTYFPRGAGRGEDMNEPGGRAREGVVTREIVAKSVLSPSRVYDYVVNPYRGCQFACAYCYARFMRRFTGHREAWGAFVDVKVNAAQLLRGELARKRRGEVWVSGVCDPYQPLEETYGVTRACLEALLGQGWPVRVQTKSDLVLRDLDLLRGGADVEVGLSLSTADETIRRIFEPRAPATAVRIEALGRLRAGGVGTYAMIAPLLPGAEGLVPLLAGKVDYIYVDRMNYHYARPLYGRHGLEGFLNDAYFRELKALLTRQAREAAIPCRVLF